MARTMSDEEWKAFVSSGTKTAKVATTRSDGRPHVVPVWFVLDDGGRFLFTTGAATVKGRTLARTGIASLVVDDETPPYSFVMVEGEVELSEDLPSMLAAATRLGGRYMGEDRAEEFGQRNAVPGELLVTLTPTRVVAVADTAGD